MANKIRQPAEASSSLYDLLWERYSASENYHGQKFICMETVEQEFDYFQIEQWIKTHPLGRRPQHWNSDGDLIHTILTDSRLLFALLVLSGLEQLFSTLVSHGFNDHTLFDLKSFGQRCISAGLTERERHALVEYRKRIGAVLFGNEHQVFPKGTVLPYRNVNHPKEDRFGGFGVVRRVEIAAGHLKGYKEKIVAMKQIRPINNDSKEEWDQLYREVETLQKVQHQNIVPLLASYFLDTTDSSDRLIKTMYLLFPWAEMDLATWMTCSQVPMPLQGSSRSERRAYIYRSMYALVSGMSYLHRENEGLITSHHDLKPSNILVIGQDFKIADLGRSHLRPADGGSETEGANGLGTYEYQPPEYWQDNGSRTKLRHGRAFDIWAMGCILIELATLIVHDWEPEQVSRFRQDRADNTTPDRPDLAKSRNDDDSSFHNNRSIVNNWVTQLKQHSRSSTALEDTLDVAMRMLVHEPGSRLYSWEAELDLYSIQNPGLSQITWSGGEGSLCVQPQWKSRHHESYINGMQTPLHRAALKADRGRMMALLSSGWHMFVQDQNGQTALDIIRRSADKCFREYFKSYLGQGITATNKNQGFALLQAAETDDTLAMKTLLEAGANPMLVNSEGRSPLSLAVTNGHLHAIKSLLQVRVEEQLLLKDRLEGYVALHQAVITNHLGVLKHILKYSPDLEDRQREGKTALFLAVQMNCKEMVKTLLDYGPSARVFTQCNTGDTPVHKAAILDNELLRLLLDAEDSARCLEHKNQYGETPVWLALRHGRFEAFRVLKERGASLRVANNDHDNLLHLVARQRLYDFLNQNLYAFDASDIEGRNRWNDTPLTIADRNGYSEIAGLLRSYYTGIVPNSTDALGLSDAPSNHPKLFYTLGSEPKWIRQDSEGYWRHLTYESYLVYERIYLQAKNQQNGPLKFANFAKQFNPNDPRPESVEYVWRRLLTSPCSAVQTTSHRKPFVLAILYMLHIERFSSERPRGDNDQPGEVKAKRREMLKRYDLWIPCKCRRKCPNQWNFASDLGIHQSGSLDASKCRVMKLVEGRKDPSKSDYEIWKSLSTSWKKDQA